MKYLKKYKLFESVNEQEVHDLCKKYGIRNYTINEDLSIGVEGNVDLRRKGLTRLPLKFRNVSGDFYCNSNKLTSLEGAPDEVGGSFYFYNNQLTSLEGAPTSVGGDFYCSNNQLMSLEDAPNGVGNDFWCDNNQLTSLEGLEWKSFNKIFLNNNPVHEIVKSWINREDREDLIEYFIDMNVIQEGDNKPKLILPRLEAFHEDMELEMKINLEEVKKYYEIVK